MFLGFYQGVVPCCLGETMVLALEGRAECFSLGRDLSLDRIEEIGVLACKHGFDFSQLFSPSKQPVSPCGAMTPRWSWSWTGAGRTRSPVPTSA
jgi:hypothetical protein